MPGLKQAGRIVNDRLKAHLAHFGFAPVPRTLALWKHATKPIILSLVVDNFGVKYIGKENADHLIQALQKLYTISIDCTGSLFCGLSSSSIVTCYCFTRVTNERRMSYLGVILCCHYALTST